MILYLLRHALAVDKEKWKGTDRQRPLTSKGKDGIKKVAKHLRHLSLSADAILTSPYKRALNTAIIVAERLKYSPPLVKMNDLIPKGNSDAFLRVVMQRYRPDASLIVVGHEPYLSRLLSKVLGSSEIISIDFKKCGLCRVDLERNQSRITGSLKWLLPPKLLKLF